MTNLFISNRFPFPKNEILTKSFLINKIASDMRTKYKKVFSVINYDELSLKNDIKSLLSKYIYNKNKEINIKYIETTILNKIREKYKKFKSPLSPIKNKNTKLIKIVYDSPKTYHSYLNLPNKSNINSAKKIRSNLPIIQNKSNTFKRNNIKDIINPSKSQNLNYYTEEKNLNN